MFVLHWSVRCIFCETSGCTSWKAIHLEMDSKHVSRCADHQIVQALTRWNKTKTILWNTNMKTQQRGSYRWQTCYSSVYEIFIINIMIQVLYKNRFLASRSVTNFWIADLLFSPVLLLLTLLYCCNFCCRFFIWIQTYTPLLSFDDISL